MVHEGVPRFSYMVADDDRARGGDLFFILRLLFNWFIHLVNSVVIYCQVGGGGGGFMFYLRLVSFYIHSFCLFRQCSFGHSVGVYLLSSGRGGR